METLSKQESLIASPEYSELLSSHNFQQFEKLCSIAFFVCDISKSVILYLSKSCEKLSGYDRTYFVNTDLRFFASLIHPEDYPIVLANYVNTIRSIRDADFMEEWDSTGIRDEFRIRHFKGHWIRLEVDLIILSVTPQNNIEKVFGVLKNITPGKESKPQTLKTAQNPLTLRDDRSNLGQPLRINLKKGPSEPITPRELEVLQLIAHGFSAKQIANKLFISIHTAINHRKHLIKKFKAKNTAELILEASKIYWL